MVKILLREVRSSMGLTQRDVAEKTLLSKSTIANIETGNTSPTLEQLDIIASALNVKISDLYQYISV